MSLIEDELSCWLLDTRTIWRGAKIEDAAPKELSLVSPEERKSIISKMHLADAKMSLASALLKRAFVCKIFRVPWHTVKFARKGDPVHGKPGYVLPNGQYANVDFNISHQAGLVALVGSSTAGVEVGVDITCVNERNDWRHIDQDGLDGWVDMYQEVFSAAELKYMKYSVDSVIDVDVTKISNAELGQHARCCTRSGEDEEIFLADGQDIYLKTELIVEAKLRRFYAFYAYKEAYIKLVGEGLLASWLKELEFRNVRSPRPSDQGQDSKVVALGERIDDVEVWKFGQHVHDVRMDIQAFENDKLITTAVKRSGKDGTVPPRLPTFELVNLQTDVLGYAAVS